MVGLSSCGRRGISWDGELSAPAAWHPFMEGGVAEDGLGPTNPSAGTSYLVPSAGKFPPWVGFHRTPTKTPLLLGIFHVVELAWRDTVLQACSRAYLRNRSPLLLNETRRNFPWSSRRRLANFRLLFFLCILLWRRRQLQRDLWASLVSIFGAHSGNGMMSGEALTGPSLTNATCIMAWKTPFLTLSAA